MSRIEIPMPQMGESIAEGTLSVWLKKVGESVERDEPIMEISTDKVDAEIPSPAAGVLSQIMVQEGETVEVGTIVGYVETDPASANGVSPPESEAKAVEAPGEAGNGVEARSGNVPSASPMSEDGHETEEERLRGRSTPLVRRIAEEHGVSLDEITGSGRAGRVTKEDVLRYVEGVRAHEAEPLAPPAPVRPRKQAPAEMGAFSWDEYYSHVEHPEVEAGPADRVEPMSRMTSLIAEHMVLSKRTSAHVHSYFEVDYSRIDQLRERNREVWGEQEVKVTYMAFIANAVAQALREYPRLNASVSGQKIVFRGAVNLGIAVALDWGLIVPVVRNADDLSIVGLARAIEDLASRARTKRLSPEEVQGGTFTITNPGIFGTVIGFPIVNQPQVAILCIGAVEKRASVVQDEFSNDAIVVRKRGYLSLGYDHRLVNGADADRFLARVKELLESMTE